jgi:hypothetical protein
MPKDESTMDEPIMIVSFGMSTSFIPMLFVNSLGASAMAEAITIGRQRKNSSARMVLALAREDEVKRRNLADPFLESKGQSGTKNSQLAP